MATGSTRASDSDREHTVRLLQEQTAQGRLTLEEFQSRVDRVYAATTWGDLTAVVEDLPVELGFTTPEPAQPATRPDRLPRPANGGLTGRALLVSGAGVVLVLAIGALASGNTGFLLPVLLVAGLWLMCHRGRR